MNKVLTNEEAKVASHLISRITNQLPTETVVSTTKTISWDSPLITKQQANCIKSVLYAHQIVIDVVSAPDDTVSIKLSTTPTVDALQHPIKPIEPLYSRVRKSFIFELNLLTSYIYSYKVGQLNTNFC